MDSSVKVAVIGAVAGLVGAIVSGTFALFASQSKEKADKVLEETRSLLRYEYHGSTARTTGFGGGKMVVLLDASNHGIPTYAQLDMDRFLKMCGDPDGCSLSLGVIGIQPIGDNQPLNVPAIGPSCRFFYDGNTKQWTLSDTCAYVMAYYKPDEKKTSYEFGGFFQPYPYSNTYGVDDSNVGGKDGDGTPLIVISFRSSCYLAESAPDIAKGGGKFMPDRGDGPSTGRGLFLIASDPSWEYQNMKLETWDYSSPKRQCILIVDD
jgi:hypothetical protein